MAVAVANPRLVTDGDAAFLRVNNRLPAHALQPGEVAAASNCRFEQGQPRPRYGVACDDWGLPGQSYLIAPGTDYTRGSNYITEITGFVVGQTYTYVPGNAARLFLGNPFNPTITYTERTVFVATATSYLLDYDGPLPPSAVAITAQIISQGPGMTTCAYARFNDPVTGTDNGVLITDEWRDDDGRGRAWRICPGNAPQEIPLNGHDVWGTARLVQCETGLLLLRHGNERHYFGLDAIDAANNKITLNCAPSWAENTSKRVRFEPATDGAALSGTTPPAAGNYYYARLYASNAIKLYTSAADAAAETNALDFDVVTAAGKFYIELAESPAPFYGNGAPNLIMEPSEIGNTAFEVGFAAVRSSIAITDTDDGAVTCPNHHFVPGDAVTPTGITVGTAGPYYAYPITADVISLHTSQIAALSGSSPITGITPNGTGSIAKTSASGLPMPPCREGAYVGGRFWGINERDTVVFSDPGDFLHFTQFTATLPANQGEAGRANWILPLGEDALIIGKDLKLIVIAGISGAMSTWKESTITGEYGGIAALAALNVGTDAWFLSRKGVASVVRTVAGEKLGVARTISQNIPADFADVDWANASLACSAVWNNRYFLAVPTKGQTTPVNNKVVVHNGLNRNLVVQQSELAGDIVGGIVETGADVDSWEGAWSGDLLTPYAFARLTIAGEERLSFATPTGQVCWLHEGWDDAGAEIASTLLTRGYFGGREMLVLSGKLSWESFHPKVTASIVTAGVNEEETLAGFDELEYDRTKYLVDGAADYNPATSTADEFSAPDREDYSPTAEELLVATLDTHQHLTEAIACRVRGIAPQLRIVNVQGSLRLAGVSLQGKPTGISATRKT